MIFGLKLNDYISKRISFDLAFLNIKSGPLRFNFKDPCMGLRKFFNENGDIPSAYA